MLNINTQGINLSCVFLFYPYDNRNVHFNIEWYVVKMVTKRVTHSLVKIVNIQKLLIECCGEISCEDGKLLGKSPEELYKWIEENL